MLSALGASMLSAAGPQVAAAATVSLARAFAVDTRFRDSAEAVHSYLDSLFALNGRTALVTGAGGGVGTAVCKALARCGADIVAADLKGSMCADTVAYVKQLGRHVEFVQCDVRDRIAVDEAVKTVEKHFGKLDVAIINHGILGLMQRPQDTSEDNWRNIMATNVDGVMHVARAAYPLLKQSAASKGTRSKIVITSSVAGRTGYGPQSAYCASKAALIAYAKSLAIDWAKDGINVNAILPGAVNTPFTSTILDNPEKLRYMKERIPLGRLAEPEDIAGAIVFLASHASDYCTGTELVVDGGGTSRAMAQ